jgi:hypothetical protein
VFSRSDASADPFRGASVAAFGATDRDERLDPPRWRLPMPRRTSLVRAIAVAALLCVAAGVLLIDDTSSPARVAMPPPAAATTTPSPPAAPPGTVGLPMRLRDSGVVTVVRAGQRVDVLAPISAGTPAQLLASGVLVLRATPGGDAPADGALLYLAVTPEQAARVAGIATDTPITVTVRSP